MWTFGLQVDLWYVPLNSLLAQNFKLEATVLLVEKVWSPTATTKVLSI